MLNVQQRRRIPGVNSVDSMSRLPRSNTTPDLRASANMPPRLGGRESGTPTNGSRDSYPVSFSDVWWLDRHGVPIPSSNVRYKGNKAIRTIGRLGDYRTSQQSSSLPSVDSAGRARSAPKQRPLGNIRPGSDQSLKIGGEDNSHIRDPALCLQAKSVSNNKRPNSHEGLSKNSNDGGHLGSTPLEPQPPRVSKDLKGHLDQFVRSADNLDTLGHSNLLNREKNGQHQQQQQNIDAKLLQIKDNQFRPYRPRRPSPVGSPEKQMKLRTTEPKVSNTRGQYTTRGIQPVKKRAALTSKEKLMGANLSMSEFYSVGIENLLAQKNRHILPALKKAGSSDSLSITVQSDSEYIGCNEASRRENLSSRRSRSKRSVRFNTDHKVHEYEPYDGWEKHETDTYFLTTTPYK